MKCSGCGRFMCLEFAIEIERDIEQSAFWWCCGNDNCLEANNHRWIPAPEHDFVYWYQDIPRTDLDADPELKAEYDIAKHRYEAR